MINKKNFQYLLVVLLIALLLMLIKVMAFQWTGSNTIFSDAIESSVNIIMGILALVSMYIAQQPKDANHPYGHGKIEFLYSTVEGILIWIAGIFIIGKSFYALLYPNSIQNLDWGIVLIGITGLINFAVSILIKRQGKKTNSPILISSAEHLRADAITSVGLILSLFIIMFSNIVWLDSAIAIFFALWIIYIGQKLIRNSISGIMDESDEHLLEDVVNHIEKNRKNNWVDVHNLRIIRYGSDLHFDLHLTLPYYFDLEKVHQEMEDFENLLDEYASKKVEVFIHPDPCIEDCCKLCIKSNCDFRKHNLSKKLNWSVEMIRKNEKHRI